MNKSSPAGRPRRARSGPPLPLLPAAAYAIKIIAVLLITYFSFNAMETRSRAAETISRTVQVQERVAALLSAVKDAETGQRGYLLTGQESYLGPYTNARATLPVILKSLRPMVEAEAIQRQRLEVIESLITEKLAELDETIFMRRAGNEKGSLDMLRSDRGKAAMDRIRELVERINMDERVRLEQQQQTWKEAVERSIWAVGGGAAILLLLIITSSIMTSRGYRAQQAEAWIKSGETAFSSRIVGEQSLDKLGNQVLEFLGEYLGMQVGAAYLSETDGRFRRFAGYAMPPGRENEVLQGGESLLGQAAREGRAMRVRDIPEGYLPVSSSLGRGEPHELLIAPAQADGRVQAVVELGFLRKVGWEEEELLTRVSESLGVAVRSSRDRTRLEELLQETQRQAEELQTQQEELRVSNEELEEQGRALKESQVRLESQQAELEQTNSQLEEQATMLEAQKDELSRAQVVMGEKATELERSNQYKSEFLANMSHELRTPLNSSLILAKILADNKQGNLTEEQVKFAQTISSAGNDLLALINDILDLSKIEAGKVEVMSETVAVKVLAESLSKTFQPMAADKGLGFSVIVEDDVSSQMETDAQRLGQILRNLLSNALKFTEKGEVSMRVLQAADGGVLFTVRDTGIGIPKEQQEVIFDAFRQADGSTHRKYGGTGLGLSISRDLARLLGGDIVVQSTPGEGSAFTLMLPRVYAGPAQDARPATAGAAPAGAAGAASHAPTPRPTRAQPAAAPLAPLAKGAVPGIASTLAPALTPIDMEDDRDKLTPGARLILVVEDDARFAAILRDMCHEMGFQCVVTHAANEGLAAASLYLPSAILLDVNLPDHSGLGVLDQLKRNPQTRHIPVHVISAADYSHEALELGAIGYALKPVKREELIEALRRLEAKFSQGLRRVLVVEDDERQRESIGQLLGNPDVQITGVASASEALAQLETATFDCMVMDLNLPDLSGYELLEKMAVQEKVSFPPVIVYTGRSLSRDEEQRLRRYSKSIIIKDARSPERLLDEVTLFLHQVEDKLPPEHQRMLRAARDRDSALEGRRILVVEDDVRNIFALSSLLEPKGAKVEIARNGREAISALEKHTAQPGSGIDLVLMDIMMPEMDGFTAMREIRKRAEWRKLPIVALTAKAMKDDQDKCLAAGANDYIAKPLDVEKLLSLLRVWMPK